jgi:sulfopyruvate decarboxylase subunit alpha
MKHKGEAGSGALGIYTGLKAGGVDFAISVPDSTLNGVNKRLEADPDVNFFVPTREDEGVAMAVGAYLGGKIPVALMEGSGVGYCGLILARAQIQRTPLLLLIGHTMILGERFDYHAATRMTGAGILQGLGIPNLVVDDRERTAEIVEQALMTVRGQKSIVGLLFPPQVAAEEASS